jgi:hypothetical protein
METNMDKMKFEFSEGDINLILSALLTLPAGQVFHLLNDIKGQISAQTDKYETPELEVVK